MRFEELIESLKGGEKEAAMVPRTYRLPPELDKEIRTFCKKNGLRHAKVIRHLIEVGWKTINE